jgi:hypothetical protein
MHIGTSYPLYCAEARQRWFTYPPPYYSGGTWYYATPWLWYDGDPHGSYVYSTWQSKIVARMALDAPVTATLYGDYSITDGSGTISAQFRNDSTSTLTGYVLLVVTEDSLYYVGSNGDPWHNHVARDYLPNQNGTYVSIAPGDSATVTQAFTISSTWDEDRCTIIAWFQDNTLQTDSTKEVWQGAIQPVMGLIGVEEEKSNVVAWQTVTAAPNPCVNGTNFTFELPVGTQYRIEIFDVSGRLVKNFSGTAQGEFQSVRWDLSDFVGTQVSTGVYFYRFESSQTSSSGKLVVR